MDIQRINQPFTIHDFSGGMRRDIDPSGLDPNQYLYAENLRVRNGPLQPIRLPLDASTGLPSQGNMQGCYQVGDLRLVFIDGRAYTRNLSDSNAVYKRVEALNMDSSVEFIYIAVVPRSILDFKRESNVEEASSPIKFTEPATGTDAGIIVQDGITRPYLITDEVTARPCANIEDWSDDPLGVREYVPVGAQMLYYDDKLYVVSPSGNEIYHSVTGRPLDFVIAIDNLGNKLSDLPPNGVEASRLSYKLDNDTIISLKAATLTQQLVNRLPTENPSGFLVGTRSTTYIVIPDYTDTIYGEPRFSNRPLFPTSPVNHFASVDTLGDTAFVDSNGLKSIESILAVGNEGINIAFSSALEFYFQGALQNENVTTGVFDNYAYFFINTKYGQRAIIYDTLTKVFVSLDNYTQVISGNVKFFASGILSDKTRVVCIGTDTGKIYELEVATQGALEWQFYSKEWIIGDNFAELKPVLISASVQGSKTNGTLYASAIVNRVLHTEDEETINEVIRTIPITPPYDSPSVDDVEEVNYGLISAPSGSKVGFRLRSNIDATIFMAGLHCDAILSDISLTQMGKAYTNAS